MQLTAEKMVTKYRRGFPVMEFVKTRDRNEALDCLAYAYAALDNLNVKLAALAAKRKAKQNAVSVEPEEEHPLEPPPIVKKARKTRSRKGGFATRY